MSGKRWFAVLGTGGDRDLRVSAIRESALPVVQHGAADRRRRADAGVPIVWAHQQVGSRRSREKGAMTMPKHCPANDDPTMRGCRSGDEW
jgi:hypothetical protein